MYISLLGGLQIATMPFTESACYSLFVCFSLQRRMMGCGVKSMLWGFQVGKADIVVVTCGLFNCAGAELVIRTTDFVLCTGKAYVKWVLRKIFASPASFSY